VLSLSCSCVLSAPPPARWSSLVLHAALWLLITSLSLSWQVLHSALPPLLVLDYSSLLMCFIFVGGGIQSARGLCWFIFLGAWVGELCMVPGAHLLLLPIHAQAGLEPVVAERNGTNFSQCSMAWGGFPWVRGSEFDSD
jgi:hypothetical protein